MIRKITLSLLAGLGGLFSAQAQPMCGFDAKHQQLMTQSPAYNQMIQQNTASWSQFIQASSNQLVVNTPQGVVYEIPVVIHVIHTGGAIGTIYNPSDAQLTGMIDYLNKSYAAQWAGYPDTNNGGTRIPIRFALAKRGPNCTTTTGINRVNGSSLPGYTASGVMHSGTAGAAETSVKALSIWSNTDYYNIWVVNKIDGLDGTAGSFVAGYAYFPGAPANVDGTIMLATQAIAGQITLPHEIGHAFGLYHTFQGGTSGCPTNANCNTDGDQVCDTEPMQQGSPGTCPTGINPCTGMAWINTQKNFMNYSNCQNHFTAGQRDKVLYNLMNSRPSLMSSIASLPATVAPTTACIPTISNPGTPQNMGPINVTIGGLNYSSGGYTDEGNQAYIDHTCLQMVNLVIGGTANLSVKTLYKENVKVFIDYNNDGTFGTNELIYSHAGTTSNQTHSTTYNIPLPAVQPITTCTPLRMRVITDNQPLANINACGPITNGQAEDYRVVFYPAGTDDTVTITANPSAPSCQGTPITFTATPSSNATNVSYKWYVNGTLVGTGPTYSSSTITNLSQVKVVMHGIGFNGTQYACDTTDVVSNVITVSRPNMVSPFVNITYPPACVTQPVTFTANPTNGGTAPTYQWFVNGNPVAGATNATYTTAAPIANGTTVKVIMTSNASCLNPLTPTASQQINAVVSSTLTPSVSIAATGNPGCPGQNVIFTATPTNGGSAPTYSWYVNGIQQTGQTSSTFSTSTLNTGDVVTAKMVSNHPCASTTSPVTSGAITRTTIPLTASVSIGITGGTNPTCAGKQVTFTANGSNAGAAPTYDWQVNGTSTGVTTSYYSSNTLQNGDVVKCVMTSNNPCVTSPVVTSNSISMTIDPMVTPTLSAALTNGNNPGCLDSLIEFTATSTNSSTNPNYTWMVNGAPSGSGTTFSSTTLQNGDAVSVRLIMTGPGCRTTDTLYTTPVTMQLSAKPDAPVISLIGNMLVANTNTTNVQWYGPSGIINGATSLSYAPHAPGYYYCMAANGACYSDQSNQLMISMLTVGNLNLSDVQIYPNPSKGELILDWGGKSVNMKINVYNSAGQGVIHEEVHNASRKVMDLSLLTNGIYFVVLQDEQGKSGTVRITLNK